MMKRIILALTMSCYVNCASSQSLQTFHDFNVVTILGDTISLSQYAGKKLLVVNTASYCGYTPQFADLQALDSIYDPCNFEVLGFPCNDFGGQDPGEDSSILGFCTGVYGVTFQMMSKVFITDTDTAEVYKWLQLQSRNGVADAPVTWNFNKFCIDENGQWIAHYTQYTLPFDTSITNWITSGTTHLENPLVPFSLDILNNPTKENIQVRLKGDGSEVIQLGLYSMQGTLLCQRFSNLERRDVITFPVNTLNSGIYILRASSEKYQRNVKISLVK